MSIRIRSARSLAYAPQYVAVARGSFAAAGVDVAVEEQQPGQSAIADAVARGEADLVLGSLVFADRLARTVESEIVAVSNQRSRHLLFARRGEEGDAPFDWSKDLRGRVVVVAPTFVPTSWVAFVEVLRRHGVALDELRLLVGYRPEAVNGEFLDGQGDLLLTGGDEGRHPDLVPVATLAEGLGPAPWSVYCATAAWVSEHRAELQGFRAGLHAAQTWLAGADPAEAARVLGPVFAEHPPEDLAGRVAEYQRLRFWAETPAVDAESTMRWARVLAGAGMIPDADRIEHMIRVKESR